MIPMSSSVVRQTPNDDLPFVSLAVSNKKDVVRGVYHYTGDDFDPVRVLSGLEGRTELRDLASRVLEVNSRQLSVKLSLLLARIGEIERALVSPTMMIDSTALQRSLNVCKDDFSTIEGRHRFEEDVYAAMTNPREYVNGHLERSLKAVPAVLEPRRVELGALGRRIESNRIAINDSILQRAQLQSLEVAEASKRIAEATMSDSASMKSVAVLTMVFLPSTAGASFFSMTMWDWSAATGKGLASPWIWVYFVVAIPLTAAVLSIWWFWTRARERELRLKFASDKVS